MLVVLNTEMENLKINSYNDKIISIFIVFQNEQDYNNFIQNMYNMESIESGQCAQEIFTIEHIKRYVKRYTNTQIEFEKTYLPFGRVHFEIIFKEAVYSDIAQLVQQLLIILKMSKENE